VLQKQHTRLGRVVTCRPIIKRHVFLGEEPRETVEGWRLLVRLRNGGIARLSSRSPMRRGQQVRVPVA